VADPDPATILVVDDDEAKRYTIDRILRRAGFATVEAADGAAALRLVARGPDLIVLDVNLPDLDGFEVCRRIKADPATASIPVLHFTASRIDAQDTVQGLEGGADAYLAQSVEPPVLVATVRALLRIRRAEDAARRSAHQWQATFDAISDGVCLLDHDGAVTRCNRAAESLLGQPCAELLGRPLRELLGLVPAGSPDRPPMRPRGSGRREAFEVPLRDRWIRVMVDPLVEAGADLPVGAVAILADVTGRRRADRALRESEERFRLLVEGVKDFAIFMTDAGGRIASWNDGASRILGYAEGEILGGDFARIFTPEDRAAGAPAHELATAVAEGRAEAERWHLRKDGSRFWASGVVSPLYDEAGGLRGFAKVMRDTTERKRMEEELRRRAAELAAADRRKDEVLAMLAHELRNPLAPVRNALEVIRLRGTDPALVEQARATAAHQVGHMARLIDDLLDVARITSGKIQLRAEPVDLAAAMAHAAEAARPLIEARGHHFELTPPPAPARVQGDPTRLEQVLTNLLNNAAKYTEPGGRITFTAALAPGVATLRVRDSGTGIAPEMLPRIFDLFAQDDRSLVRSQGGLGIGLTLVRSLVELHDGTVTADSAGPGLGSEFVVRLPTLPEGPADPGRSAAPASPPAGPPRRVLVVDDHADSARTLARVLELWGHAVRVAHSGPEAIAQVAAQPADLILLDIGLPEMDGYEVARRLRDQAPAAAMTLIALTGYGQDEDRRRSRAAGFDHHLVKPVDLADLQRLLERV